MSVWDEYGGHVGGPSDSASQELESRLTEALKRRDRRRAVANHASYVLLGLAAALIAWFAFRGVPWPGDPDDAVEVATQQSSRTIELPNEGRLEVEPDTQLDLDASAQRGADVRLHAGAVTLDVHQGNGLKWVVRTGAYSVEAVGTRFRVRASEGAPEVTVFRGEVRITGPELPASGVHIEPGDPPFGQLASASLPKPAVVPDPAPQEPAQPAAPSFDDVSRRSPAQKRQPTTIERFRQAVSDGDTAAAVGHLPADFPGQGKGWSAADYLNAGDALAAQGQSGRARRSYVLACAPDSKTKACAVATYRTALVLAREGKRDAAIRQATTYLQRYPKGALVRQALARRMRWQHEAGKTKAAATDAQTYLDRWPEGPDAPSARRMISAP